MKSAFPGILRLIAILALVGGVVLGLLDAYGLAKAPVLPGETIGSRLPSLVEAVAMVLGLVALAAVMWGLAEFLDATAAFRPGADSSPDLSDLQQSLRRLETAFHRLADHPNHAPGSAEGTEVSAADTMAGASMATSESLHQVMVLLQEIRELVLMTHAQRQQKLKEAQQHRRNYFMTELQRLVELKEWSSAGTTAAAMAGEFPGDSEVEQWRQRIESARKESAVDSFSQVRQRVEDLIAAWAWDQAYLEAARFVGNFPENSEGRDLLAKVQRDRDTYIDESAQRLYADIRLDIDRRSWRRAMANSLKLLEVAPGHRRSAAIRTQLQTIRENAEIQERQEQESRIQELIRAKQFAEAIILAEDLLRRFPNSPQAESLQKLLPKMRERAIEEEIGAEAEAEAD